MFYRGRSVIHLENKGGNKAPRLRPASVLSVIHLENKGGNKRAGRVAQRRREEGGRRAGEGRAPCGGKVEGRRAKEEGRGGGRRTAGGTPALPVGENCPQTFRVGVWHLFPPPETQEGPSAQPPAGTGLGSVFLQLARRFPGTRSRGSATLPEGSPRGGTHFCASALENGHIIPQTALDRGSGSLGELALPSHGAIGWGWRLGLWGCL